MQLMKWVGGGLGVLWGVMSLGANAQIYKYVDDNGRVTYSNVPIRGAKKLDLEPLPTMPAPAPGASRKATERTSSESYGFPKVDVDTQRKRDDMRRKILDEELASEQQLLAKSRQNLIDKGNPLPGEDRNGKAYSDRLQPIKDSVALHEKNIEQIKREIANLK